MGDCIKVIALKPKNKLFSVHSGTITVNYYRNRCRYQNPYMENRWQEVEVIKSLSVKFAEKFKFFNKDQFHYDGDRFTIFTLFGVEICVADYSEIEFEEN